MLYASTKATFKKEFGAGQIKDEYYANLMEEITLAGYKRHLAVEAAVLAAPVPPHLPLPLLQEGAPAVLL